MNDLEQLKKRIRIAAGTLEADLVIKNCTVVDVYTGTLVQGDIAVSDGTIAGIGSYRGAAEYDAAGLYAAPGLIDGHIHIESSYVRPEEFARMVVPHGTTTVIADPHEITNVCGLAGFDYMVRAAERTPLSVRYMLPSCVPATPFEHNGCTLTAQMMDEPFDSGAAYGLGEFMNYPGILETRDDVLDKILQAHKRHLIIDGHSPALSGKALNAYASAGIGNDHECTTLREMDERLRCGMYILLRQGAVCTDLQTLLKNVTPQNARRCVLCTDDPETMLTDGHLDNDLAVCVAEGIPAVTAIQMATLNAAECFRLHDRGGLAPGLRADIVLFSDLRQFSARAVFIAGKLCAERGVYLHRTQLYPTDTVRNTCRVRNFSAQRLALPLKSARVTVIEALPGGIVTRKALRTVSLDSRGRFRYDKNVDAVKLAVIERHRNTGNVGIGLLAGYGLDCGAIATTNAHDSHNIIVAGADDGDMAAAVERIRELEGGIVLVKNGAIVGELALPIAGLMSTGTGAETAAAMRTLRQLAFDELHVRKEMEPLMTLSFMALPVIPEIKLTDNGPFDVTRFEFIPVEAES
ncbi:adenine deaminase [Treponema brennaborense]|uniref:Adenine deaminase n=1 Tax=Treponema brennaborense (strain DSM 12168 / CIP 105900 / DD5/3) TaxID=906968 RepID=F4LPG1_TREBD|nr:adenine deaminase [Treponema brennaborense]AEE15972.1 Adenine deaminase [Treponema brennaborense DSM 12168]